MKKVFKTVELSTDFEQNIRIYATPEFDGIEVEFKEADDKYSSKTLYLDEATLQDFVTTLQEMMNYTKEK
jgi:hypothetical protein